MTDFARNTQLLLEAVRAKDAAEVQRLIPLSYSMRHLHFSHALIYAIEENDVACARLLAPAAEFMETTLLFSKNISVDMLYALLPWCDSDDRYNYLVGLTEKGTVAQIETVAQHCQLDTNSLALEMAVIHHRDDVVDVLYPLSNGQAALKNLQRSGYPDKMLGRLKEHIKNQQLRETLIEETSDATRPTVVRKM